MDRLEDIVNSGIKLTPMMEQYFSIKKNYKDALLLFRMGDFYEVFFEDAKKTSKLLNIALTHRGKISNIPIPMAGIPHHAATTYIDKLTMQGIKVAICEQIEDPKEAVGIVKRAVTQIVSPGMPYDLDKAEAKESHFLCAGFFKKEKFFLSFLDFTTGEFKGIISTNENDFVEQLKRFSPKEIVTTMGQWDSFPLITLFLEQSDILITYLSNEYFKNSFTAIYIERLIPFYSKDKIISKTPDILNSIGALSYYVLSTQGDKDFSHIRPFSLEDNHGEMKTSISTLSGLEILPKGRDSYRESLLGFFDKTQTASGARTLKKIFISPLTSKKEINKRVNLVESLISTPIFLGFLREELEEVRDIERILTKASTKKANGGDLINIARSILAYENIHKKMETKISKKIDLASSEELQTLNILKDKILKTINDEIGASLDKGNLIKDGADKKRDKLSKLSLKGTDGLKDLEKKYREETGISNLKVKSNNVAGHFIEVSKSHLSKIPEYFVRRQTLVNSERFMTEELSEYEKEVILAKDRLEKLEREIFNNMVLEINELNSELSKLSNLLAYFDIIQCFAWIAIQEDFSKPELVEDEKLIELSGAWHPLIKATLKDEFTCHHLTLNKESFFGLITGPNMAGKTTVMREVAIIQFLAQLGSFVPAKAARLGICDFLFSRLGASDDILKGQSTFMVEMSETAEIIRHATERSLIVMDEVGRGTSTYDGMSIAWALVEYFVKQTKALTLFSTHYHELIELVNDLEHAKNLTVETTNNDGEVKFLYHLVEKAANQSFGIYVAKLAGLPPKILKRSQSILTKLEKMHHKKQLPSHQEQLTIFSESSEPIVEIPKNLALLKAELEKIEINDITPMEALKKLNELKSLSL